MPSYKNILFPVDLTEASSKIAPHVNEIADKFGAEIHIVYAAHVRTYYAGIELSSSHIVDFEAAVIRSAEKQLEKFVTAHFKDRTVKTMVVVGHTG